MQRLALAGAVVLLHLLAFHVLLTALPGNVARPGTMGSRSVAWIALSPPAVTPIDERAPIADVPFLRAPSFYPQLPAEIPLSQPAAHPDPALTILKDYLACRSLGGNSWTEDRERCEKMLRELPVGPPAPDVPTAREIELARRFEHEHAVQIAPLCFLNCRPPPPREEIVTCGTQGMINCGMNNRLTRR